MPYFLENSNKVSIELSYYIQQPVRDTPYSLKNFAKAYTELY